jgi:hypothetical protein
MFMYPAVLPESRAWGPVAFLCGLTWFVLAVIARVRLGRRGWWAFLPAPLVLFVPGAFAFLFAACSVRYCDF